MNVMRVFTFAVPCIVLAGCSGGGSGNTQPTPIPTPLCLMTLPGLTYTLRSPANNSFGVSTAIGLMDISVQTDPGTGALLPPSFPGATLVVSAGANVAIGGFTQTSITPGSGVGGASSIGDFQAAVPTLAPDTTYSVSLLTKFACPQTIGSFTTL